MFKTFLNALGSGWKTLTGAAVWAYGHLEASGLVQLLPPKWGSVIETVGAVLAAFGLYHAAVRGPGQ
jgi:hypothetical protein